MPLSNGIQVLLQKCSTKWVSAKHMLNPKALCPEILIIPDSGGPSSRTNPDLMSR